MVPIIDWALGEQGRAGFEGTWADLRAYPEPPRSLSQRVALALQLYPCDILFVHRDANGAGPERRVVEIEQALERLPAGLRVPAVCVIPVRMLEAWLLHEEAAIRKASGNGKGSCVLELPRIRDLEGLDNPKEVLIRLIEKASDASGRRLQKLRAHARIGLVADFIGDLSPLRELSAFREFEQRLRVVLEELG